MFVVVNLHVFAWPPVLFDSFLTSTCGFVNDTTPLWAISKVLWACSFGRCLHAVLDGCNEAWTHFVVSYVYVSFSQGHMIFWSKNGDSCGKFSRYQLDYGLRGYQSSRYHPDLDIYLSHFSNICWGVYCVMSPDVTIQHRLSPWTMEIQGCPRVKAIPPTRDWHASNVELMVASWNTKFMGEDIQDTDTWKLRYLIFYHSKLGFSNPPVNIFRGIRLGLPLQERCVRPRGLALRIRRGPGEVKPEHRGRDLNDLDRWIPSGKHTQNYGKSPFLMGKSTISMAIFNSFLYVYQMVSSLICSTISWF